MMKEHLLNILADIREVVWCINADTYELLYANNACLNIWGYQPEQMMADPTLFFQSMHPDDISTWQAAISEAKEKGSSFSQLRVSHKDGNMKYLQGDAIFKKGSGSLPDTITGVGSDVTEVFVMKTELKNRNKELESVISMYKNLQRKNEQTLSLLQSYQNAIDSNIHCSITDQNGTITYVNEKFCEITKYSKEDLIGKNHRIISSGHHSKSFFGNMWKTISAGKMWTGEIKNRAKDGTFYWVETVIMPIVSRRKEITGFLSLRIAIDERKTAEILREEYLKAIEDMLFMVSHEIRRPITGCQGVLNLLQERRPSEEEYSEYLGYLVGAATELDSYSRKLNEYLQKANHEKLTKGGIS